MQVIKFSPKFDINNIKTVKLPNGETIDYYSESNTRKNALELNNGQTIYFANPLVYGNGKLDKSIAIFDILAVNTCYNCKQCKNTCYAVNAQRRYPTVYNKRLIMSYLAKNNPEYLKALIVKQLSRSKKRVVRIHSSGEFFSQEYVNLWIDTAKQFPNIRFYTYTKMTAFWDFSNKPENFNIVNSILPDGGLNYGTIEYVNEKAFKFCIDVCPVTAGIKGAKCGHTCQLCQFKENMLFLIHK